MVRSLRVRTGTGLPGQCPLDSATRLPCSSGAARGRELPEWGAAGGRGRPQHPSVGFLGCLHRAQAITSPRRPWPSNGCWKSEPSRTSLTSDLGTSCTHSACPPCCLSGPQPSPWGRLCQHGQFGLPLACMCGWSWAWPGPRGGHARLLRGGQLARMEARGGGSPAKEGGSLLPVRAGRLFNGLFNEWEESAVGWSRGIQERRHMQCSDHFL